MVPRIEGLCPLLQVFDMAKSVEFYRRVLGFEVAASAPPGEEADWCLLRSSGSELMLNSMYERASRPAAPEAARRAAHADTTLFLGCRDLDAAHRHVVAEGVEAARPVVRDYGMRQLSFRDPDGYGICLQWSAG